jgi:hypothetical protein
MLLVGSPDVAEHVARLHAPAHPRERRSRARARQCGCCIGGYEWDPFRRDRIFVSVHHRNPLALTFSKGEGGKRDLLSNTLVIVLSPSKESSRQPAQNVALSAAPLKPPFLVARHELVAVGDHVHFALLQDRDVSEGFCERADDCLGVFGSVNFL